MQKWLRGFVRLYVVKSQAFDVSGVSEYAVASNMVRNRIFYIEIRSIEKDGNTPTAYCRYPSYISVLQSILNASIRGNKIIIVFWTVLPVYWSPLLFQIILQYL